jgi:vitamin B12 transporter
MHSTSWFRFAGRSFVVAPLAGAALFAHVLHVSAQTVDASASVSLLENEATVASAWPLTLERIVVTATRTPLPASQLGSAFNSLMPGQLERAQISSLRDTLRLAGVALVPTGAPGGTTSVFLRGANSGQVSIRIDGVRANDSNTDYFNFLGGGVLTGANSVEVLRGPQSSLYGANAIGGVIAISAFPGCGPLTGVIEAGGGSFGTWAGAAQVQGEHGATAYNVAVRGGTTDNDRPNNRFRGANAVARIDQRVSDTATLGVTVRTFSGAYGSPGAVRDFFNPNATDLADLDNEERESNTLATLFAELKPSADWSARLTAAGQHRRFVSEDPSLDFPAFAFTTVTKNERALLDAQASYSGWEKHRLTLGGELERSSTESNGFGAIDERQTLWSLFAQDEFTPVENVFLTAAVRHDDFDSFGGETTVRATSAALWLNKTLKTRASFGTGFRAPSFLDLYGEDLNFFYRGNPNLASERARGWDAGVDYYLPAKRGTLSATFFQTRYRDLIAFTFDPNTFFGTVRNFASARTQGFELSAELRPLASLTALLSYTYTDALDTSNSARERLLRRPRHLANAEVSYDVIKTVTVGVGATLYADATDFSAVTFLPIQAEDYVVARAHVAWRVSDALALKARIENLGDTAYESPNGFPQLGRGFYGSVEWKF